MSSSTLSPEWTNIVVSALGILAALLVLAVLTGMNIPLISGDRTAFITLAAIGLAMCALGMGRSIAAYGWLNPINIVGMVLGVLLLWLVFAVLAGRQVPLISGDRAAFIALAVIGFSKWALAGLQSLFWE